MHSVYRQMFSPENALLARCTVPHFERDSGQCPYSHKNHLRSCNRNTGADEHMHVQYGIPLECSLMSRVPRMIGPAALMLLARTAAWRSRTQHVPGAMQQVCAAPPAGAGARPGHWQSNACRRTVTPFCGISFASVWHPCQNILCYDTCLRYAALDPVWTAAWSIAWHCGRGV